MANADHVEFKEKHDIHWSSGGHYQQINPAKKMNEYFVPFLLDSLRIRIFLVMPHDRHESNDKPFGKYVAFYVGGKLDLRINEW